MISHFQDGNHDRRDELTASKLLAMLEGTDSRTIVAVAANAQAISHLSKNWVPPDDGQNFHISPKWVVDNRLPAGKCMMIYTHEALAQYVKDLEAGKPLTWL